MKEEMVITKKFHNDLCDTIRELERENDFLKGENARLASIINERGTE